MLQKLALTGSVLVLGSVLLTGCAQTFESLNSLGQETPPNAPPGYHSFKKGQQGEKSNDLASAAVNYCNAAELGHPHAKSKCLEFAYRAALKDPIMICQAYTVDQKADQICGLVTMKKTRAQGLREIKAGVKEFDRNKMKARIKSGEFTEFKAEEF